MSNKNQKTITFFIGRKSFKNILSKKWDFEEIYPNKGKKDDWMDDQYPPIKLVVTEIKES